MFRNILLRSAGSFTKPATSGYPHSRYDNPCKLKQCGTLVQTLACTIYTYTYISFSKSVRFKIQQKFLRYSRNS